MANATLKPPFVNMQKGLATKHKTRNIKKALGIYLNKGKSPIRLKKNPHRKVSPSPYQLAWRDYYCTLDWLYRYLKRYYPNVLYNYYLDHVEEYNHELTAYQIFTRRGLLFELEDLFSKYIPLECKLEVLEDSDTKLRLKISIIDREAISKYDDIVNLNPRRL